MGKKRSHDVSNENTGVPSVKKQKSAFVSNFSVRLVNEKTKWEHQEPYHFVTQHKKPQKVESGPFSNSGSEDQKPQFSDRQCQYSQDQGKQKDDSSRSQALNFPPSAPSSSNPSLALEQSSKTTPNHQPYNGHSSTLPPLPPILSPDLAIVPFTHAAYYHTSVPTKVHTTYDRLEFLGDAYIELISTRLTFLTFPNLTAGRLSQHREMLVKNETLAEYALAYHFDQRARIPESLPREGKVWTKIMGDVFEAYVAAVIMSDPEYGFQTVEAWLSALWQNKLPTHSQTADVSAKPQLGKQLLGKGIKLNYQDEKPPEEIRKEGKVVFHIGVYLTGWGWENQHLGSGMGLSKQEAGAMAAAEALGNPLTREVGAVKRLFDEKVAEERRKQEELVEEGDKSKSEAG